MLAMTATEDDMTLSDYLREARESAGMTRTELARAAATSHTTIARLESGQTPSPGAALLHRLSVAYGWTPHELRLACRLAAETGR